MSTLPPPNDFGCIAVVASRENAQARMSILTEYRSSLKHAEVEELLDLIFFRSLAFVLVKAVLPFRITPNQITIVAILCGVTAGFMYGLGTRESFIVAATLYGLSNVLDCADGMVARLKRNGTEVGRIIDGVADYITSIAVYLGLGVGLTHMGADMPLGTWTVVVVGGFSQALQAFLFDYYRNEFLARLRGEHSATAHELAASRETLERLRTTRTRRFRRLLIRIYIRYSTLQVRGLGQDAATRWRGDDLDRDRTLLRLWSYVGSTTHIFLLVLTTLLDRIEIFFAYTIIAANVWTLILWLVQRYGRNCRLIRHRTSSDTLHEANG